MSSFFAMGGHAAYIWPAYAVAGLVLGGIAVASWRSRVAVRRELAARGLDRRARERTGGT